MGSRSVTRVTASGFRFESQKDATRGFGGLPHMTPSEFGDWALAVMFAILMIGCSTALVIHFFVEVWRAYKRDQ